MSWPSYYKMTISLYARESGRAPHWQGASTFKISNYFWPTFTLLSGVFQFINRDILPSVQASALKWPEWLHTHCVPVTVVHPHVGAWIACWNKLCQCIITCWSKGLVQKSHGMLEQVSYVTYVGVCHTNCIYITVIHPYVGARVTCWNTSNVGASQ